MLAPVLQIYLGMLTQDEQFLVGANERQSGKHFNSN
jgi:hypothetical protein